jgi:hypothetical protein
LLLSRGSVNRPDVLLSGPMATAESGGQLGDDGRGIHPDAFAADDAVAGAANVQQPEHVPVHGTNPPESLTTSMRKQPPMSCAGRRGH